MNCPKCGAENPNESCWCGKCGNKLELQERQAEMTTSEVKQPKKKKRKAILAVSIIAALGIIVGIIFMLNPTLTFNEEEKKAVQAVELVQERLLKPESIRLYAVYCYEVEDKEDTCLFIFDYGADNKGGGVSEASALVRYENGTYCIQETTDDNESEVADALVEYAIALIRKDAHPLDKTKIEKAIK